MKVILGKIIHKIFNSFNKQQKYEINKFNLLSRKLQTQSHNNGEI